jgi:hypothetical protein
MLSAFGAMLYTHSLNSTQEISKGCSHEEIFLKAFQPSRD